MTQVMFNNLWLDYFGRYFRMGFCGSSGGKDSACNVGDPGLIPGQEDPLKKGMATHSIMLAWEIPWTEEPGGPQASGSQGGVLIKRRAHTHPQGKGPARRGSIW